jgi:hypothetical protein
MSTELDEWPPMDPKAGGRAKPKPLYTFGTVATTLIAFGAGFVLAILVFPPKATPPEKPMAAIKAKLSKRLPVPPGMQILSDGGNIAPSCFPPDPHRGASGSLFMFRDIKLAEVPKPGAAPATGEESNLQLAEVRDFYADYFRSMGFHFNGLTSYWCTRSEIGPQAMLYVTVEKGPFAEFGKECIFVHIVLSDTGYTDGGT